MGSGIEQGYITFKNDENGNTIYGYDYDADGIISIKVGSNQAMGEYKFHSFRITDNAYQENSITINLMVAQVFMIKRQIRLFMLFMMSMLITELTIPLKCSSAIYISLWELRQKNPKEIQIKMRQVLTSFKPRSDEAYAGEMYHIDYVAEDIVSGLANIQMRFETEQVIQ